MLKVILLGTSGSMPTVDRSPPSILIKKDREGILFDCGEGTQRQMMRAHTGINISSIFITHWHADHFLGLPGLIHTLSFLNREDKLDVYGPRWSGVPNLFALIRPQFDIDFIELATGDVVKKALYTVKVVDVNHSPNSFGYVFEERERPGKFNRTAAESLGLKPGPMYTRLQQGHSVVAGNTIINPEDVIGPRRPGRKIVYTGDTRPSDSIVEVAGNADLLIHDSTLNDDLTEYAKEVGHSTAKEAAEIAKRSAAFMLVLTHISSRYANPSPLLKSAKEIFENTILGEDLLEIDVQFKDKR
ncbi:MAG TPA: ribonuclease Z [Candidatus Acidoferrales bacterium]|nr:ribonuclease Z [Candidatus Acidoferrales bacterium]